MFGLSILAVLFVYFVIAITFIVMSPGKRNKLIVALIFLLIPTWDVIPKRLFFHAQCILNTSTKINEKANNSGLFEQEPYGFYMFDFPSNSLDKKELEKSQKKIKRHFLTHNLRRYFFDNGLFNEIGWRNNGDHFGRFWIDESGSESCVSPIEKDDYLEMCGEKCIRENKCIAGVKITAPNTDYVLKEGKGKKTFGVQKIYSRIQNRRTGEILAEKNSFYLYRNWVVSIIDNGLADSCGPFYPCLSMEISKSVFEGVKGTTGPFEFTPPEDEKAYCY